MEVPALSGLWEQWGRNLILFDGAMGTMLQQAGLPQGTMPEGWNVECPDAIRSIHRAYLDAGCDVVTSNTFGANALKCEGTPYTAAELVGQGVRIAREAVEESGRPARVAVDIGPTGKLLEPLGDLAFEAAYTLFAEMAKAGDEIGAGLLPRLIEQAGNGGGKGIVHDGLVEFLPQLLEGVSSGHPQQQGDEEHNRAGDALHQQELPSGGGRPPGVPPGRTAAARQTAKRAPLTERAFFRHFLTHSFLPAGESCGHVNRHDQPCLKLHRSNTRPFLSWKPEVRASAAGLRLRRCFLYTMMQMRPLHPSLMIRSTVSLSLRRASEGIR